MSEENRKSGTGFYVIAILILLIGVAYLTYMWSAKRAELAKCANENLIVNSKINDLNGNINGINKMMEGYVGNLSNDLKTDLKSMLETYDKLINKDKSKADSLNIQKGKIQSLLNELSSNKKLSASQLFQLKKENETLRNIMKGYVKQIDALNTLNLELTSKLDVKSTELNNTITERDIVKSELEENKEKVKKGSALQAYDFNSVALASKWNSTTKETDKAKNAIQISSTFTVSKNPLTSAGKKSVYLQIINPDGRVLQANSSNTVDTDQGNEAYSDKKVIDYQKQAIDESIYYDFKSEKAVKGNYKIKVICDGIVIGTDSITLK